MPKPKSDRKRVLATVLFHEQDGRCSYCDRPMLNPMEFDIKAHFATMDRPRVPIRYPTLDHIKPAHEGGTWHISNLTASCWECNHKKAGYNLPEELVQNRDLMIQLFRSGQIKHYLRSLNAA